MTIEEALKLDEATRANSSSLTASHGWPPPTPPASPPSFRSATSLTANASIRLSTKNRRPSPGGVSSGLRNIEANPRVSLVIDDYSEDWTRLGYVLVRGRAEAIEPGGRYASEHARAVDLLRGKYPSIRHDGHRPAAHHPHRGDGREALVIGLRQASKTCGCT